MDIVNFWKQQTDKWAQDEKCGMCWAFHAPLTESALNLAQLTEEHKGCINLFLTNLSFLEVNQYSPGTGLVNGKSCEYQFTLYALQASRLGQNNYNEMKGYSVNESKWATVFKPVIDCLSCDVILDFCEIQGYNADVTKWAATMVTNYQDNNYDGWRINATFRIKE